MNYQLHSIADTGRRLRGLHTLIESPEYMPARFWRQFAETPSGCWEWQGSRSDLGYGKYGTTSKWGTPFIHRQAYTALVGPIPDGLDIDHLCRNRACGRPDHLEAVPHVENCRRGLYAQKTHCKHGHSLDPRDGYVVNRVRRDGSTYRQCGECVRRNARVPQAVREEWAKEVRNQAERS